VKQSSPGRNEPNRDGTHIAVGENIAGFPDAANMQDIYAKNWLRVKSLW